MNQMNRIFNRKLAFISILLIFLPVGLVQATSIFEEDFESYDTGNLNGQGGWTACLGTGNSAQVMTLPYEGEKSAVIPWSGSAVCSDKTGSEIATGTLSIWVANLAGGTNNTGYIEIGREDLTSALFRLENSGKISWYSTSSTFITLCQPPLEQWFELTLKWEAGTDKVKYICQNPSKNSGWVDPVGESLTFFNWVRIYGTGEHPLFYVDLISGTSTISAEYPTLPEEEDCSEMGLPDRLMCEIKNLFQGVYLFSPEKIEELSTNIDFLKERFPINYLSSASDFISDVRTQVNSSSSINFKILGQTGSVNLNFWNSTTSLGGTPQTFGTIFKGFFSIVFLGGFIAYAQDYGKRIFK